MRGPATIRSGGILAPVLLAVVLAGCAGGQAPRHPAPGSPAPVPMADTLPIREPSERSGGEDVADLLDESLTDEAGHLLSISRAVSGTPEARNVTPFDDVVPSAWFEHRIGGAGLTPEEVAEGPPGPDPTPPFTVVDLKVEGVTPGFTVEDAAGHVWVLKFDPPGMTGLTTGADVVTSRIFWAAGYHVPRDVVLRFDPEALRLAPDATVEDPLGERLLARADVERALADTDRGPDGTVRALASLFLEGVPKGPFAFEGTRPDDPNDHYPHEDRRELRGMWVPAMWTNHVDLRWQNTLDMWHAEPGYLKHHLIDFGTTLGSGGIRALNPREGREYSLDLAASMARLVTLGFYRVGWEGSDGTPLHPALGWLPVASYDPAAWKPFYPAEPYRRLLDRDGYWGAKLVAAFGRAHLEAIVAEAGYPEAAADTLVEILEERRRRTVNHWYARVTAVEEVEARRSGGELVLSFRDLGLEEGVRSPEETVYRWRFPGIGEGEGRARGTREQRQTLSLDLGEEGRARLERATPDTPLVVELSARAAGVLEPRWTRIRLHAGREAGVVVSGVLH